MPDATTTGERICRICETPSVHVERKRLRYGLVEEACECVTCGQTFKTFSPGGFVFWWGMAATLCILTAVGFATGKVKDGDGPGIVFCVVALLAPVVYIGTRALIHHRRNPRVQQR